jgi:hypothetical protein
VALSCSAPMRNEIGQAAEKQRNHICHLEDFLSERTDERGPNDRRLWKKPLNEKKRLFYNIRLHRLAGRNVMPFDAVLIRPGEDGVRGELAAIAPTE